MSIDTNHSAGPTDRAREDGTDGPTGSDGPTGRNRQTGTNPEPHPAIDLRSTVVEYETRPDRITIYPREGPSDRKLTTWLTANDSAFLDLEEHR